MATPKEEYFGEMVDYPIEHNHCHNTPMSNENFREAVIRLIEDEENTPNITSITLLRIVFFQSPVTVNA